MCSAGAAARRRRRADTAGRLTRSSSRPWREMLRFGCGRPLRGRRAHLSVAVMRPRAHRGLPALSVRAGRPSEQRREEHRRQGATQQQPHPSCACSSSASGGLAPSLAHGSSNSTRHLPSSFCISASRARNVRPRAALEAGHRLVGAPGLDQLAGDHGRQLLARLALPDHEAAARILARPARVALAVLDDVVAADRARAEVGARDAHVLELRVELADRRAGELRDVAHELLRDSVPSSIAAGAAPTRRSATARSAGARRAAG